jgi:hypothetical protein
MRCTHRWRVEEFPTNSTYRAVCQLCECERTFTPWRDEQARHRVYNGTRTVVRKPKTWEGER